MNNRSLAAADTVAEAAVVAGTTAAVHHSQPKLIDSSLTVGLQLSLVVVDVDVVRQC